MVLRTGKQNPAFSPGWHVYSSIPEGPTVAELGEIQAASIRCPSVHSGGHHQEHSPMSQGAIPSRPPS